jgi:hypothetical protein
MFHGTGTTLVITFNDYDMTDIVGVYKVLKDFEDIEVHKEYIKQIKPKKDDFSAGVFYTEWLVKQEYLEEVEYEEIFL